MKEKIIVTNSHFIGPNEFGSSFLIDNTDDPIKIDKVFVAAKSLITPEILELIQEQYNEQKNAS